ncbi:S49 family peptidase [Fodinicurvata sp. EGI_FJ10296]|uniref:S49 family peptidase n=1 Tax=Fodinicurvata sp. EGI_FJ10296 TaxID=3231908 RepID=UPI0034560716
MWRFIVRLFAVIGLLFLVGALGGGIAAYHIFLADSRPPPPDRIVLSLDLRDAPVDVRPNGGGIEALLGGQPLTLYELESALERAANDPRVLGVSARFGGDVFGLSMASEIEAAIERFQESDKPTVAFADSFGAPGPANASYMVASAFDRIILRPIGALGLTGLAAQPIFAGEALDDLGVSVQFVRSGPYKTFPETLTGNALSEEHREMLDSILEASFAVLTNTIAENRGIGARDVAALIDAGPLPAAAAQSGGLVDTLGGDRALADRMEAWFGADMVEMTAKDYLSLPVADGENGIDPADAGRESDEVSGPIRVALIHADGMILEREADQAPGGLFDTMSATSVAETIDDVISADEFDAVLLRLDTGGGSAIGSELIANALSRARDSGLATVVSMGASAASGGYWVAVHADRIVATPTTLTGSIGVFSGKVTLGPLAERLGVTVETIREGRNADMWSFATPFSPEQLEILQASVDDLHAAFLDRVASGRDMPHARVADLAGGRVWTGLQAADLGLVDSLGGLHRARDEIRDLLSVGADEPMTMRLLPEEPDFLDDLMASVTERLSFGARSSAPTASLYERLGLEVLGPMGRPYAPILPMLRYPEAMTLHMPFAPAL